MNRVERAGALAAIFTEISKTFSGHRWLSNAQSKYNLKTMAARRSLPWFHMSFLNLDKK